MVTRLLRSVTAMRFQPLAILVILLTTLLLGCSDAVAESMQTKSAPLSPSEKMTAIANDLNYNKRKPQESLPYYEKALRIDPYNLMALSGRADALIELGKPAEGIAGFDKAIAACPDEPERDQIRAALYRFRAQAYEDLSQWQKAVDDYTASLKCKLDQLTYYFRGAAYEKLGSYKMALHDLDTVILVFKPSDQDSAVYAERGLVHKRLGEYQKAVEDYDQAIKLSPEVADSYFEQAEAFAQTKQYRSAIEDYTKALEKGYLSSLDVRRRRGELYALIGEHKEAVDDFTEVLKYTKNDPSLLIWRGVEYRFLREREKALEDLNKAIEMDPDNALAYDSRGITKKDMKDTQGALSDLGKALLLAEKSKDGSLCEGIRADLDKLKVELKIKKSD